MTVISFGVRIRRYSVKNPSKLLLMIAFLLRTYQDEFSTENHSENSDGQWLGIVNATANGTSQANIVAIEFDTRRSYSHDLDDNHVGLISLYSIEQVSSNSYGVNLSTDFDEGLKFWVWIVVAAAVVVVLLSSGVAFYFYRKKRNKTKDVEDTYPSIEDQIQSSTQAPRKFKLRKLIKATDEFNLKNQLGIGGFGTVYKGT
ncbi:hypothetical protein Q3G72_033186 [Acer saccharum]|nr:hypothetical protein Q3G72_033186 [Acer saccharum]